VKWLYFHYDRVAENVNCINVQFWEQYVQFFLHRGRNRGRNRPLNPAEGNQVERNFVKAIDAEHGVHLIVDKTADGKGA
jgi:hypothetical protein